MALMPAQKISKVLAERINFESSDLIVNNRPDLPLKVPLEQSSLAASVRVEQLKKKNLLRFEGVAHRLKEQAEQQKLEYSKKIKQKR